MLLKHTGLRMCSFHLSTELYRWQERRCCKLISLLENLSCLTDWGEKDCIQGEVRATCWLQCQKQWKKLLLLSVYCVLKIFLLFDFFSSLWKTPSLFLGRRYFFFTKIIYICMSNLIIFQYCIPRLHDLSVAKFLAVCFCAY